MGKRHKQQAVARARAGRATIRNITGSRPRVRLLESHVQPATDSEPDVITDESDGECGYTGGVNCCFYSDGEEGDWSDDDNSELEQLDEMEGEELENNLQALKAAMDLLEVPSRNPTIFDKISRHHSLKDWENAKKKLGYSGNLSQTQRRRDKDARDQAEIREAAKIS